LVSGSVPADEGRIRSGDAEAALPFWSFLNMNLNVGFCGRPFISSLASGGDDEDGELDGCGLGWFIAFPL